ncbi:MAG: TolC family protein [Desulfomonilaceae bacterium]
MKRLKLPLALTLFSFLTFAVPWFSEARQSDTLSLLEAVRIALARNLTMADSRLAVTEKEYQRREAFSDFFPLGIAQYNATFDRYINQYPFSYFEMFGMVNQGIQNSRYVGLQEAVRLQNIFGKGTSSPGGAYPYRMDLYRLFTSSVTLTQPIFNGGKLLNDYKYAKLGVDYSSIQYEVNRQDLILNVYRAYYQMGLSLKLLKVANESIKALEGLRDQTRKFYQVGLVPKVDLLSTEGQLAQARIQKTQSVTDIARNQALLNYLLRNPQETPLKIDDELSYKPNHYKLPEAYAIAAANRLEIRQAHISVEQALALVKSAKADLLPNADVALTGIRYNDDWNVVDPEGTNDFQIQGLANWTFDMFRRRSTVQQRRSTRARSDTSRRLLVESIMNEVKQAYEDMRRSESDISDNEKAVAFRRESFRINRLDYEQQVATYVEVLDAQRQLSLSEGQYYLSLAAFKANQATLERKMGILK